jgi:hypothetical protein
MPSAVPQVRILHGDCLPPPINLAYDARADAGALRFVNVAMYVKPGMHHGDVRRQEAHLHLGRLSGACPKGAAGSVQTFHRLQVFCTGSCPRAVDGDELGVIGQRFHHGNRVMTAPRFVETQLNFANRVLVCFGHENSSAITTPPRITRREASRSGVAEAAKRTVATGHSLLANFRIYVPAAKSR